MRTTQFDGKLNRIFSFLCAVGLSLQLARLTEQAPERAKQIYVRRLLALLAIGLVHAIFSWYGDVLVTYALCGFALLLLRRVSNRGVWVLFGLCLLYPGVKSLHSFLTTAPQLIDQRLAEAATGFARSNAEFGAGGYADMVCENWFLFIGSWTDPQFAPWNFIGW